MGTPISSPLGSEGCIAFAWDDAAHWSSCDATASAARDPADKCL